MPLTISNDLCSPWVVPHIYWAREMTRLSLWDLRDQNIYGSATTISLFGEVSKGKENNGSKVYSFHPLHRSIALHGTGHWMPCSDEAEWQWSSNYSLLLWEGYWLPGLVLLLYHIQDFSWSGLCLGRIERDQMEITGVRLVFSCPAWQ